MPSKKRYRLCLGGKACVYASTLDEVQKDVDFWLAYGAKKIIVAERLPSGRYSDLRIVTRETSPRKKAKR